MASSPPFEKSHYTTTSRTYPLTTVEWPDEGVVVVSNVAAVRLATFSCEFLKKGHITDWHYVVEACSAIVNEKGVLYPRTDDPLRTRLDRTSTASYAPDRLELSEQIRPMHLVYVRTDDPKALTSWQIGPRFKYKMRGPSSGSQSSGTLSHSSRSTALQSEFRNLLGRRDGSCVVTDAFAAEAAHIIPQSRPEYYEEILGFDPVYYFDVSYGLYLSKSLHMFWDKGDWALYPDPEDQSTLVVHIFEQSDLKHLHGKRIPPTRFRSSLRPPNRRLLAFHYRQCILKHIRGFEVFPTWQS